MTFVERIILTTAAFLFLVHDPLITGDPRQQLRNGVASSVATVYGSMDKDDTWFGTGFHVTSPSGQVYIVTNRHVCERSKNGQVYVEAGSSKAWKKILYEDPEHDLCLVEKLYSSGLHLAPSLSRGEKIAIVGHPSGYDITMTEGEAIGYWPMSINERITTPAQEANCKKWKDSTISTIKDSQGNDIKVCTAGSAALITTAQVKAGSSGSPVVNQSGKVVGVIYCIESDDNWGRAVPLKFLRELLQGR